MTTTFSLIEDASFCTLYNLTYFVDFSLDHFGYLVSLSHPYSQRAFSSYIYFGCLKVNEP